MAPIRVSVRVLSCVRKSCGYRHRLWKGMDDLAEVIGFLLAQQLWTRNICRTSPSINIFHHHPGQPITLVSFRQDYLLPHQRDMSQQKNAQSSNRESRIQLALSAYTARQFRSLRRAAEGFNITHSTLTSRYNGIMHILKRRNGRQKLTATKEQTITRYILDLDSRGFAPRLCEVEDMADKVLSVCGG